MGPRFRGSDGDRPNRSKSRRMTWQIVAMFVVAAVLTLIGAGLLVSLSRPSGPARIYVFRMVGVMALAAGIVLGFSAWSMQQWSVAP